MPKSSTSWKKGEKSPNPSGKPVGTLSLVSLLKKKLEEIPEGEKKTYAELFIDKYLKEALKGKGEMIKDAIDRIDGKPKQAMEMSGPGGGSIGFAFLSMHQQADDAIDSEKNNESAE